MTTDLGPLQCQQEVARFASTTTTMDQLRTDAIKTALHELRNGNRAAALRAMYDGLAAQAPLSFRPPRDLEVSA